MAISAPTATPPTDLMPIALTTGCDNRSATLIALLRRKTIKISGRRKSAPPASVALAAWNFVVMRQEALTERRKTTIRSNP